MFKSARNNLTPGELLIAVVFAFAFIVALMCFKGWLFAMLWNFVVPMFWPAAPHMTWLHGLCVVMLFGMLFGGSRAASKS